MTPMTEVIKASSFEWNPKAQAVFQDIKAKLTQAPMLALPYLTRCLKLNVMHPGWA